MTKNISISVVEAMNSEFNKIKNKRGARALDYRDASLNTVKKYILNPLTIMRSELINIWNTEGGHIETYRQLILNYGDNYESQYKIVQKSWTKTWAKVRWIFDRNPLQIRPRVHVLAGTHDAYAYQQFARGYRRSGENSPIIISGGVGRETAPLKEEMRRIYSDLLDLGEDDTNAIRLQSLLEDDLVSEAKLIEFVLNIEGIASEDFDGEVIIYTETLSTNTPENIENSLAIIKNDIMPSYSWDGAVDIQFWSHPAHNQRIFATATKLLSEELSQEWGIQVTPAYDVRKRWNNLNVMNEEAVRFKRYAEFFHGSLQPEGETAPNNETARILAYSEGDDAKVDSSEFQNAKSQWNNPDNVKKLQESYEAALKEVRMAQAIAFMPQGKVSKGDMPNIKAFAFDWDDTIFTGVMTTGGKIQKDIILGMWADGEPSDEVRRHAEVFFQNSLGQADALRFEQAIGVAEKVYGRTLSQTGQEYAEMSYQLVNDYIEAHKEEWVNNSDKYLMGGIVQWIRDLKAMGYPVYLVTAGGYLKDHDLIGDFRLTDLFDGIHGDFKPGFSKTGALGEIKGRHSDRDGLIVMLGDGGGDMKAANATGNIGIALANSNDLLEGFHEASEEARPDVVLSNQSHDFFTVHGEDLKKRLGLTDQSARMANGGDEESPYDVDHEYNFGRVTIGKNRVIRPGFKVRDIMVEGSGVFVTGRAITIDPDQHRFVIRAAQNVLDYHHPKVDYKMPEFMPNIGYTASGWYADAVRGGPSKDNETIGDSYLSSDLIYVRNGDQGHFWNPDTLMVAFDEENGPQLIMKTEGKKGLRQDAYEKLSGVYSFFSLDPNNREIIDLTIEDNEVIGRIPFKRGFGGIPLIRNGKNTILDITAVGSRVWSRQPNQISWDSLYQRMAFSTYAYNEANELVIFELAMNWHSTKDVSLSIEHLQEQYNWGNIHTDRVPVSEGVEELDISQVTQIAELFGKQNMDESEAIRDMVLMGSSGDVQSLVLTQEGQLKTLWVGSRKQFGGLHAALAKKPEYVVEGNIPKRVLESLGRKTGTGLFVYTDIVGDLARRLAESIAIHDVLIPAPDQPLLDAQREGVLLIRPNVSKDEDNLRNVLQRIRDRGYNIAAASVFDGAYPEMESLVSRHYDSVAEYAKHGKKAFSSLNLSKMHEIYHGKQFKETFGKKYREASIYGALELRDQFGLAEEEVLELWEQGQVSELFRNGEFNGLNHVGVNLSVFPVKHSKIDNGEVFFIVNGYYLGLVKQFTQENAKTVALLIRGIPGEQAPWAEMRSEFLGDADPSRAQSGSLRSDIHSGILESVHPISISHNGFHLSLNSIEAASEAFAWFKILPRFYRNPDALPTIEFSEYLDLARRANAGEISAAANVLSADRISLPDSDLIQSYESYDSPRGDEAFSQGKIGHIILAGGSAGKFAGYDVPEDDPRRIRGIAVKPLMNMGDPRYEGVTAFEFLAAHNQWMRDKYKADIPLWLFSSENNRKPIQQFFEENNNFGLSTKTVHHFTQGALPRRNPSTASLEVTNPNATPQEISDQIQANGRDKGAFYLKNDKLSLKPPGHLDAVHSFILTGELARAIKRGVEYLYIGDNTNLGGFLDPGIIDAMEKENKDFAYLLLRKPADNLNMAGGSLALVDEKPTVVEGFRFPADFDHTQLPYFNSGYYVLRVKALAELYDIPLDGTAADLSQDELYKKISMTVQKHSDYLHTYAEVKDVLDSDGELRKALQFTRLLVDLGNVMNSIYLEMDAQANKTMAGFLRVKTPEDIELHQKRLSEILPQRIKLSDARMASWKNGEALERRTKSMIGAIIKDIAMGGVKPNLELFGVNSPLAIDELAHALIAFSKKDGLSPIRKARLYQFISDLFDGRENYLALPDNWLQGLGSLYNYEDYVDEVPQSEKEPQSSHELSEYYQDKVYEELKLYLEHQLKDFFKEKINLEHVSPRDDIVIHEADARIDFMHAMASDLVAATEATDLTRKLVNTSVQLKDALGNSVPAFRVRISMPDSADAKYVIQGKQWDIKDIIGTLPNGLPKYGWTHEFNHKSRNKPPTEDKQAKAVWEILKTIGITPEFLDAQNRSMHVEIDSFIPRSSGLGGSVTLDAIITSALLDVLGLSALNEAELASFATLIEAKLGDFGSVNDSFLVRGPHILNIPFDSGLLGLTNELASEALEDVSSRFENMIDRHGVLFFTGVHRSRDTLSQLIKGYLRRQPKFIRSVHAGNANIEDFHQWLLSEERTFGPEDAEQFGKWVSGQANQWEGVLPGFNVRAMERILEPLYDYDLIVGHKPTGAGNGGFYFLVLANPEDRELVEGYLKNSFDTSLSDDEELSPGLYHFTKGKGLVKRYEPRMAQKEDTSLANANSFDAQSLFVGVPVFNKTQAQINQLKNDVRMAANISRFDRELNIKTFGSQQQLGDVDIVVPETQARNVFELMARQNKVASALFIDLENKTGVVEAIVSHITNMDDRDAELYVKQYPGDKSILSQLPALKLYNPRMEALLQAMGRRKQHEALYTANLQKHFMLEQPGHVIMNAETLLSHSVAVWQAYDDMNSQVSNDSRAHLVLPLTDSQQRDIAVQKRLARMTTLDVDIIQVEENAQNIQGLFQAALQVNGLNAQNSIVVALQEPTINLEAAVLVVDSASIGYTLKDALELLALDMDDINPASLKTLGLKRLGTKVFKSLRTLGPVLMKQLEARMTSTREVASKA